MGVQPNLRFDGLIETCSTAGWLALPPHSKKVWVWFQVSSTEPLPGEPTLGGRRTCFASASWQEGLGGKGARRVEDLQVAVNLTVFCVNKSANL